MADTALLQSGDQRYVGLESGLSTAGGSSTMLLEGGVMQLADVWEDSKHLDQRKLSSVLAFCWMHTAVHCTAGEGSE